MERSVNNYLVILYGISQKYNIIFSIVCKYIPKERHYQFRKPSKNDSSNDLNTFRLIIN